LHLRARRSRWHESGEARDRGVSSANGAIVAAEQGR
jgi:hypothetical protein